MVYGLLGVNWLMADTVGEELWAWGGMSKENVCIGLIPLTALDYLEREES